MAPINEFPDYRSRRINSAGTVTVKSGSGVLHSVAIGTDAAGTIAVADATGTICSFKSSMPANVYLLDVICTGKIDVTTTAPSPDLTVMYR